MCAGLIQSSIHRTTTRGLLWSLRTRINALIVSGPVHPKHRVGYAAGRAEPLQKLLRNHGRARPLIRRAVVGVIEEAGEEQLVSAGNLAGTAQRRIISATSLSSKRHCRATFRAGNLPARSCFASHRSVVPISAATSARPLSAIVRLPISNNSFGERTQPYRQL